MQLVLLLSVLAVTAIGVRAFPAELNIKFSTTASPPSDIEPDHVPSTACENMLPAHGPNTPSNKEPPYDVIVSQREVQQGDIVTVVVSGQADTVFKGLYIQGRINDKPVGRWLKPSDNPQVTVSDCPPGRENALSFVTRLNGLKSLTLQWVAPSDIKGDLIFQATIAKSYAEFWTNVRSSPLKVVSRRGGRILLDLRQASKGPSQQKPRVPWKSRRKNQGQDRNRRPNYKEYTKYFP